MTVRPYLATGMRLSMSEAGRWCFNARAQNEALFYPGLKNVTLTPAAIQPLSPAENAQRHGKCYNQPRYQYLHRNHLLAESHSLQHVSAHGVDGRHQRQRPHYGLNAPRKAGGRKEDA